MSEQMHDDAWWLISNAYAKMKEDKNWLHYAKKYQAEYQQLPHVQEIKLDPGDYMQGGFIYADSGYAYKDKIIGQCHNCNKNDVITHESCGVWLCRKEECKKTRADRISKVLEWQRKLYEQR